MIYCKKCGVELETTMSICPLCGEPIIVGKDEPETIEKKHKKSSHEHKKWNWQRIKQSLRNRIPPFRRIFHI